MIKELKLLFRKKQPVASIAQELFEEHLDPFFTKFGFIRKGTDYRKPVEACTQHIYFRVDTDDGGGGAVYYFANLEFPAVERLLEYGVFEPDAVNTIGKQMGYLNGKQFEDVRIASRDSVSALARRFMRHIEEHALPFLAEFSDMRRVVTAFAAGESFNLDRRDAVLKQAAFLFLLGEKEAAVEALKREETRIGEHPQVVRFIRFRNYLESLSQP